MIYGSLPQWAMDPDYMNPSFFLLTGCRESTGMPMVYAGDYDNQDRGHGYGEGTIAEGGGRWRQANGPSWGQESVFLSTYGLGVATSQIETVLDPMTRLVELAYS